MVIVNIKETLHNNENPEYPFKKRLEFLKDEITGDLSDSMDELIGMVIPEVSSIEFAESTIIKRQTIQEVIDGVEFICELTTRKDL
jgi:hypothetical protein